MRTKESENPTPCDHTYVGGNKALNIAYFALDFPGNGGNTSRKSYVRNSRCARCGRNFDYEQTTEIAKDVFGYLEHIHAQDHPPAKFFEKYMLGFLSKDQLT